MGKLDAIKNAKASTGLRSVTKIDEKTYLIGVDQITPNPKQPRDKAVREKETDESIESLALNIKEFGQINPISVIKIGTDQATGKDRYMIESGERRWLAIKKLGWREIVCCVRDRNKDDPQYEKYVFGSAVSENMLRKDMSVFDQAKAIGTLIEQHGYTINTASKIYSMGNQKAWDLNRIYTHRAVLEQICNEERHDIHAMGLRQLREAARLIENQESEDTVRSVLVGEVGPEHDTPAPKKETPAVKVRAHERLSPGSTYKSKTRIMVRVEPGKITINGRRATVEGQFEYIQGIVNSLFDETYNDEAFQQYLAEQDLSDEVRKIIETHYTRYKKEMVKRTN